jgi:hypothetical protein
MIQSITKTMIIIYSGSFQPLTTAIAAAAFRLCPPNYPGVQRRLPQVAGADVAHLKQTDPAKATRTWNVVFPLGK